MAEKQGVVSADAPLSDAGAASLLESLRTSAVDRLSRLSKDMFSRIDTVLYDWARALPDSEQQRYMDVMVVVRGKRAEMEGCFVSGVLEAFARIAKPRAKGVKSAGVDEIGFEELSLVDTDEMDISVAIDSMVAKSRLDLAAEIGLLRRRFAHAFPKAVVDGPAMPLDPGAVAEAFKPAIRLADELGVPEKLLILKVFQRLVMQELEAVLADANQLMVDAGVLPNLKLAFAQEKTAAKKKATTEVASKHSPETEDIFSILQQMMMMGRATSGAGMPAQESGMPVNLSPSAATGVPGAIYHAGRYVGGGGIGQLPAEVIGGSVASVPIAPLNISPTAVVQTVATPELLSLLSQIQQQQPKAPLSEDASSPSVVEVRSSIRDNLSSTEDTVEAIKQADEDIINLVSMLFDFILDDDDLPTAMKALIGRLQIPLLKVAILDKSFFNAETHPARRLLNALAKAGIGWSSHDQGGDALYAKIEEVVFRILNEFIDDLGIFDELLEEFTSFHEQQQRREETVDKRMREAEEGKARAELARAMVQQTLNRRLTGRQLPLVAVRLLQDAWRNVLYINCLKEGTDSEAWKQAVKVVDAVIWSVLPQGQEWQARLKDVAPKLTNSLKKGLAAVNYDPLTTETLLRELAQVHLELMRGQETRTVSVLDASAAPVEGAGQVAAQEVARTDAASVQSVVLPMAEAVPAPQESLPGDSEHVLAVSRLNVGSWVEFSDADHRDRNKLVARIRSVDKLIFANRRGIKVGEMTGMKLAVDMSLGRARVVEEGEFIDRALESVIGNLRDLGSKHAPGT